MLSVRIKFNKTEALKFISHLDLNRTVKKIIIRANIPLVYSEGFNPHPKIVFSSTLSLGVESFAEFVDIKLNTDLSIKEIKNKIIEASPNAFVIKDVYIPTTEFKEIDKAEYELFFDTKTDIGLIKQQFEDNFIVERVKNKKSRNPTVEKVDILPFLSNINIIRDKKSEYIQISVTIPANSGNYINPELIAGNLKADFDIEDYFFRKINMLKSDGEIFA